MKTYLYTITALAVALLLGSVYYAVGAYSEPTNGATYPLSKLDTGPASQSKAGNLFISSASMNGTVMINQTSTMMLSGLSGGTINVGNVGGQAGLVAQGLPLGFMWNKNASSGALQASSNLVSIGTSSTYGTFTIDNGSPTSAVMNIINDAHSDTVAVGAYYGNGSWRTLNAISQPMAITFDAASGLWFESGAGNNSDGTIYWRKSMQLDRSGNITFSNRLKDAPDSTLQWVFQEASSSKQGAEGDVLWYCSNYSCDSQNEINGTPPSELTPVKPCANGDYEYFPIIPINGIPQYAIYSCVNGSNGDTHNQTALTVGNLFVQNQSYGTEDNPNVQDFPYANFSSSTAPNEGFSYGTSQDDNKTVELLECPDGRYVKGFTVGNTSNLTLGGSFGTPSFNVSVGPGMVMSLKCAKL